MDISENFIDDIYAISHSTISHKASLREVLEEQVEVYQKNGGKILPPESKQKPIFSNSPWNRKASPIEIEENVKRSADRTEREKKQRAINEQRLKKNNSSGTRTQSATEFKSSLHYVPTIEEIQKENIQKKNKKRDTQKARRRNISHNLKTAEGRANKAEHERKQKVKAARDAAQLKGEMYFTAPCKHHEETLFRCLNSVTRCMDCIKKVPPKNSEPKPNTVLELKNEAYYQNRVKMETAIKEHQSNSNEGHVNFLGTCLKCGPDVTLRVRYRKTEENSAYKSYYCISCQSKHSTKSERRRIQGNRVNTLKRREKNTKLMEIAIQAHNELGKSEPITFVGKCLHCGPKSLHLVKQKLIKGKEVRSFLCISCQENNTERRNKFREKMRKQQVSDARKIAIEAGEKYFTAPCRHHGITTFYTTADNTRCVACTNKEPPLEIGKSVDTIKEHERLKSNRVLMLKAVESHTESNSTGPITFIGNCGTCGDGTPMKVLYRKSKSGPKPTYFCIKCNGLAKQKKENLTVEQ